ncbi:hypothetical protein Pan110_11200 [Gimesia panareensis]|nr:hypothetical protein Pan110_11200 [Gimesia panareensis]
MNDLDLYGNFQTTRLTGNPCNFSVYGRKVYSQALR